jgi:hypothetical protein
MSSVIVSWAKGGRRVELYVPNCLEILTALTSQSPNGLPRPVNCNYKFTEYSKIMGSKLNFVTVVINPTEYIKVLERVQDLIKQRLTI